MQRRENTFRIDYSKIPKKPSYEELHHFIGEVLGMKREEVKRLQCSKFLGCAFVKASSFTVAERIVQEHDGKHVLEVDKKKYYLRLWMEDGGVDVKLHDLSEDVQDNSIINTMKEYGDILSIRELLWDSKYQFGAISTGVRLVRMIVKKNIPSTITIDSETTCVSYSGQLQTCKHCNEFAHNGITCVQNKKLMLQKLHADKSSYVNVVKQAIAPKGNTEQTTTDKTRQPATKPTTSKLSQTPGPSSSSSPSTSSTKPNGTMPPPPSRTQPAPALQSDSDFPALGSQQHQTNNEYGQRRTDGHDTDSSTTSTSSRRLRTRPPGKKMRPNDEENSHDEN